MSDDLRLILQLINDLGLEVRLLSDRFEVGPTEKITPRLYELLHAHSWEFHRYLNAVDLAWAVSTMDGPAASQPRRDPERWWKPPPRPEGGAS